MKKLIVLLSLVLISSTSIAAIRTDVDEAFTFLYSKSDGDLTIRQRQQMGRLYLAILKIENICLTSSESICSDNSISENLLKMNALENEIYNLMGQPRTAETISRVKQLDGRYETLGNSLVTSALRDLSSNGF